MTSRIISLSVCFLVAAVVIANASKTEQVPPRESLATFPYTIGAWTGRKLPDFTAQIMDVLGVDEYVNRLYHSREGTASLYIGYYQSQRQGDSIHSPLNCLPGSGWEPLSKTYLDIPVTDGSGEMSPITVNRYVIQKGLDRQVVLYWYHGRGRAVANEYRSKILMVYDAVRLNRTDAALVRVVSPWTGSDEGAEQRASDQAVAFVKAMFPLLDRYLPS